MLIAEYHCKIHYEEKAIAWDTMNAQADDKQGPAKYVK